MEVIRAEALGLCFGVRDALAATETVPDPHDVTIYGELVHNEHVNRRLVQLGFRQVGERERQTEAPATGRVLITAHGVSNTERARLREAGRELIDTTCPLVSRAHEAALRLDAEGRFVVVIGRRGHVEVRGLTGDLRNYAVVESPGEARPYAAEKIGVIAQTTSTDALVSAVLDAVRAMNPGRPVRYVDTVCRPTRERQQALRALLPRVDVLIVVGGRNSRNTNELVEAARARGVPAFRVAGASELVPAWFIGCRAAGLTAGTSTLDEAIEEVHRTLLAMQTLAA